MVEAGWTLLILLQNIYQTHCQKQCSVKKIEFLCYFSNLRILELVCENAKTQATPQSIASPVTHSHAQWLELGCLVVEKRPPRPRTGAPIGRGQIQRAAKGPVEFRGSQGRSADQVQGILSLFCAHHPKAVNFVPFCMSERCSSRERSGKGLSWEALPPCYCSECHQWEIIVLGVCKPRPSIICGLNTLE